MALRVGGFGHGIGALKRRGLLAGAAALLAGVYGQARTEVALAAPVVGESNSGLQSGVSGRNTANGVGVEGSSMTGVGVFGASQQQIGVRADSTSNYGMYGTSGLTALRGEASGSGVAVVGVALNPGAGGTAAQFVGNVLIQGSLTVTGTFPKSAAVTHPDGSLRRVYCQESTEAWFEDFGSATLTNGRAVVDLDSDFDAVVKGDDYLVFMTAGPHRFVVEELKGGKSTLPFSYRVVSRRRDNVGRRLEKVDLKGPPAPKSLPQPIGPDGRLLAP
jgi:hypothetical protein